MIKESPAWAVMFETLSNEEGMYFQIECADCKSVYAVKLKGTFGVNETGYYLYGLKEIEIEHL